MYSKIAFANSTRVFHRLRFNSSICIEDQNDSIIAVSRPSPTVPNDGWSPAERILSPKTQEMNRVAVIGVHYPAWFGAPVAEGHV